VLVDKAYDADRIRELIQEQGATPNIPPKSNRRWGSSPNFGQLGPRSSPFGRTAREARDAGEDVVSLPTALSAPCAGIC
jgi:transposase